MLACPCCGSLTLSSPKSFEICPVCYWEDDGQDDRNADEVCGGPNGNLSLTQARLNFSKHGASDPKFKDKVRPPTAKEKKAK
jgi:hypothetical protein